MTDAETERRINYDIDFVKLRDLLKSEHSPVFYNFYACQDIQAKREPYITRAVRHRKFLDFVGGIGYNVVKKDLKYIGTTIISIFIFIRLEAVLRGN
ncbi:MAG: hypothetical protein HYT22_00205 [Candidatus Niyogibacteria bacterium]|nr:hypothetical protein [Candidatus Niyogibacteria bacterium]